ncbi:MAG: L-threonylcarbamoyladenylate synthase [Actinobacteria bacterium]|nr:L-threonylcarbamoyladenylate synthase [Actinomycetota bacterium]
MITTDVQAAAAAIRAGGLVGMPTETVYGLAADATNRSAIERLYTVKGRPTDHPSIVHIATVDDARSWVAEWPAEADLLARRFWPGPLTLILPAGKRADPAALGGTGTVALRLPDNLLALELIEACGTGLAAPSANRFGRVSPTTALHVAEDLGSDVDVILDGGRCGVGLESTIVDLTGAKPRILRPGAITAEMVEEALQTPLSPLLADAPRAPGTLAAHYAPRLPVVLIAAPSDVEDPRSTTLIAPTGTSAVGFHAVVDAGDTPATYAERLYALLRASDMSGAARIAVLPPEQTGIGIAVMDRLRRAAASA